jgi:hypothetical protein
MVMTNRTHQNSLRVVTVGETRVITGIARQDDDYLGRLLLEKGRESMG